MTEEQNKKKHVRDQLEEVDKGTIEGEHVRDQLEEVDKDTVSATNPSYKGKLNLAASAGPKHEAIAAGKPPFDPDPGPFEDQQDPRRPIGQYVAEGQPPLQKK